MRKNILCIKSFPLLLAESKVNKCEATFTLACLLLLLTLPVGSYQRNVCNWLRWFIQWVQFTVVILHTNTYTHLMTTLSSCSWVNQYSPAAFSSCFPISFMLCAPQWCSSYGVGHAVEECWFSSVPATALCNTVTLGKLLTHKQYILCYHRKLEAGGGGH